MWKNGAQTDHMNWRRILLGLAIFKVAYLVVVFTVVKVAPAMDAEKFHSVNARWPREGGPTFGTHFTAWDGAHYLYLSEVGYHQGVPSCAFYPLWPLAMRGLAPVFGGNHLVAGMLLGNFCSLAAWVIFWQLVAWRYSPSVANWSLAFLVAFPGSLFYQFIYSEPLFFLLLMVLWWGLERGKLGWAGLAAFLLPLTRPVGVFAMLPLAWAVFGGRLEREWGTRIWCRLRSKPPLSQSLGGATRASAVEGRYALLAAPLAGWGVYLALMWHWTGNALEGFQAQRFWGVHSVFNLVNIPAFVGGFFSPTAWHDFRGSVVDRITFVLLLYTLPIVWRQGKDLLVWAYILGVLPAMSGTFCSFTRYADTAFPMFIALAAFTVREDRKWLRLGLLAVFVVGHVILAWRFVNFRWAG